ncbi:SubName: Full=Uncharacterized protein {ECO:0000313/EMBL:CCA67558.1} [Serendipita indica DSM 11827]|nr:SubName: Full=Uncharacterized protein {ECO:0000313/EMBL:CCA67558.1} [Serendipita indica DSM 11827]
MASPSRHPSSSYGVAPTVGGSTIVQTTTAAADEEHSPIDRDALTRSPVDMSRYPTVYEQNGQEQGQHPQHSRPPSAQPRRSTNVSRIGTSRVESPISDSNYPSWLPRRPLAPAPPGSTGDTHSAYMRTGSPGGYYNNGGGGSRLADLFNFSRGHSRNVTQSSNRVSTAMSGFITNPSEYGGPSGRRATDDSGNRKPTGESGDSGGAYSQARRGSSGDYYDPQTGRRRATPRSVRYAPGSVDHVRGQEPTEQTRRASSSASQAYGGYGYGYAPGHRGEYTHVRAFSRSATNPYAARTQSPLGIEPPNTGWMSQTPTPPVPAPRFRARNLNLSLLRSPSKFIKLRYLLQPVTFFAHVPIQLFFDFNVVYILVQITKYPTPLAPGVANTSPSPSWLFALILYLLATLLWLVGVVLVYEIAWSFWRRWRVKRPGMLGIFSSRPARKLVGMGSYDRFCFLEYVQRGAWTDRTELDLLLERDREIEEMEQERRREAEEGESMGGGWEGKEALRNARLEAERLDREVIRDAAESDTSSIQSLTLFQKAQRLNYKQGMIEWAWNRSQNLPTVALLVPRACIAFIIILTFTKTNPLTLAALASAGSSSIFTTPVNPSSYPSTNSPVLRDQTFFSGRDGTLTHYARTVLWIDCIWTLWRTIILIAAYVSLWIASGQSCAGVCGPRYRWEEIERQEWEDATNAGLHEKFGSGSRRHLSLSGESTIGGLDRETGDIADQLGWQWRENTRRRVREAYEFCLLAPLPHRRRGSTPAPLAAIGMGKGKDGEGEVDPEPLTGLAQALLPQRNQGRKGLVPDLFDQPTIEGGLRDSIQLVPPSTHLPFSVESNSRSGPLKELPYPFPTYKGSVPPIAHQQQRQTAGPKGAIPFPNEDEPQLQEDLSQIEDEYPNQEEYLDQEEYQDEYLQDEYINDDYLEGQVDEMGYLPERATSASLSSLGQPLPSGQGQLPYVGQRTRSSMSTGPTSYSHSQYGQSPRNSGYKSTSSKSNSGDQSRRKSSAKSSASHYSPRTHKSSGSQQSPGTDSSTQQKLRNILPPPSASTSARFGGNGNGERRRAVSATQLSRIVPSPMPSEGLARSLHAASSGALHDVAPEPYASEGEHDDQDEHEEQGDGGEVQNPVEEHEDSVGLLSNAPSHQGSLAALRARASSFTESLQRIRTRSQGASSHHSNSNSSGQQRARTRSAAAPGGGATSSGSGNGRRERTESHAMSTMSGRSGSRSRTSSIVPVIGARYTSSRPEYMAAGRPSEFGEVHHHYEQEQEDYVPDWVREPVPPLPTQTQSTTPPQDRLPQPPSSSQQDIEEERIRGASVAPSERTIQAPPPLMPGLPRRLTAHENVSIDHPDISTARESFITLPATVDTGSTGVYRGGEHRVGQGASSAYLHEHAPQP